MRRRPLLQTLAAGAALTVAGCPSARDGETSETTETAQEPLRNPPPPDRPGPPSNPPGPSTDSPTSSADGSDPSTSAVTRPTSATTNPPAPRPPPPTLTERQDGRPGWDAVSSPHPSGATNPPSPVLLITPKGQCFKAWEGGMLPPGPDRIVAPAQVGNATAIDCPQPRATEVWMATGGRVAPEQPTDRPTPSPRAAPDDDGP